MAKYVPYENEERPSLNNFFLHFPRYSPGSRQIVPNSYRDLAKIRWRTSYHDFLEREDPELLQELNWSDLFFGQTGEEFYVSVDAVLAELGITHQAIADVIERAESSPNKRDLEMIDSFLRPVYIALRLRGYNSGELVG